MTVDTCTTSTNASSGREVPNEERQRSSGDAKCYGNRGHDDGDNDPGHNDHDIQRQGIDNYERYNDQVTVIQRLLTELVLFYDWGVSIETDYDRWSGSRLRKELVDSVFDAGVVLSISSQRSFVLLHTDNEIRRTERVVEFINYYEDYSNVNGDEVLNETTICIPINVIKILIQDFPDSVLRANPWTGRTALHEAVDSLSRRHRSSGISCSDDSTLLVIRALLMQCPNLVFLPDNYGTFPIDALASIVLMKEESFKYASKVRSGVGGRSFDVLVALARDDSPDYKSIQRELMESWECARMLVVCHCNVRTHKFDGDEQTIQLAPFEFSSEAIDENAEATAEDTPLIHACVAATKIPLSLIEQAIRRFADQQLAMADSRGNLPLHLVAAKKVGNRTNAANVHGVSDNYDNEDTDILNEIFVRYPKASEIVNNDGLLPIDLAIGVGRRWETGLSCLLKANPKGLAENLSRREIPPIHFPTIFSALLSLAAKIPADTNANDTVIFRILRAYPEA